MPTPQELLLSLSRKTALSQGVTRLYRFAKFDPGALALMLSGGMVRMSNVRFFNDPYDCRPIFHPDCVSTKEEIEGFIAFMRSLVPSDKQPAFEEDVRHMRDDPEFRAGVFRELERQAIEDTEKKWRLLCFGKSPFSHLLWSHYGDSHRGMCIEFDSNVPPFSGALKVSYDSTYPRLKFAGAEPDTFAQVGLLTKADCWSYEDEYRLISAEVDGSIYPRSHHDYLEFPKAAVKAVILGLKADPAKHEEARYLIRKFSPSTEFKLMVRDRASYELKITANALDWPPVRQRV